jgi:hypothetical protein
MRDLRCFIAIAIAALAASACEKKDSASPSGAPSSSPSSTTPNQPAPTPQGTAPGGQPPADPSFAQHADPAPSADLCTAALTHMFNNVFQGVDRSGLQAEIELCQRDKWPVALLECSKTATNTDDWRKVCGKRAFEGRAMEMKPVRTFDVMKYSQGEYASVQPPALSQDGDMMTGGSCNSLTKLAGPVTGVFVICDGSVVAGPLTHPDEISAVYAEISRRDAAAFELGRRIRANWPSGCSNCRYRVYDQHGNYLRDEN